MLIVLCSSLLGFLFCYTVNIADTIDLSRLAKQDLNQHIMIYDRQNNLITQCGNSHDYVSFEQIPKNIINALISTEDMRFWMHRGLNLPAMLMAGIENVWKGKIIRGGSTITQQLAKNLLINQDSSLSKRKSERKIKEIIIAFKLEKVLSKQKIMEYYLNRVYFGRGAYGISAAAKIYFGKDLNELSIFECVFLTGLVKAPSRYSSNRDKAIQRAIHVANRLHKAGFINQTYSFENMSKEINLINYQPKLQLGCFADWVVTLIPTWIRDSGRPIAVYTTLDTHLQNKLINSIDNIKAKSRFDFSELGFIGCDPDGSVRVMVGGLRDIRHGFNRVTQAFRQSGSIFKIYTYLTAFLQGIKYDSVVEDTPPTIGDWTPGNYYHNEVGFVTLERAFSESINGATVRIAMECGLNKITNVARLMGLTGNLPNDYSLILGSGCITLSQLAQTMLIIVNNGKQVIPYGILMIRDCKTGEILWTSQEEKIMVQLIDNEEAINQMLHIMKSVVDSKKGTGRYIRSDKYPVAGKTGTSQEYRDIWFASLTPFMIACAWCGHDNNAPMFKRDKPGLVNPAIALCKCVLDEAASWLNYKMEDDDELGDQDDNQDDKENVLLAQTSNQHNIVKQDKAKTEKHDQASLIQSRGTLETLGIQARGNNEEPDDLDIYDNENGIS